MAFINLNAPLDHRFMRANPDLARALNRGFHAHLARYQFGDAAASNPGAVTTQARSVAAAVRRRLERGDSVGPKPLFGP